MADPDHDADHDPNHDHEKERDFDREREKERDLDREREKERDLDREREREREHEREHEREREHDRARTDAAHSLTLDALLQTVLDGVVGRVRRNAESALDHLLANYFLLDPQTGQPTPRTVQVPVSGPNGTPIQRDLPLYTLVPPQDVEIDHLLLKMKLALSEQPGADGKPSLRVNFVPAGDAEATMAEIEIRFRGIDSAEGLARINGAVLKHIAAERG